MEHFAYSIYSVLLAGGTGTRLWPVSRELYPKQLVRFIGDYSLIQNTIKRFESVIDTNNIRIVCAKEHLHETARHMKEIGIKPDGKIICEPCGRNTAPAVLLAILNIITTEEDAILCVFPADHVIKNISLFHKKLKSAIKLAGKGYIVTFGIKPNYPETGYGYIEASKEVTPYGFHIKRFVEKPDKETAQQYLEAGNFYWNSGMFVFRAGIMLDEFKKLQPALFEMMTNITSRKNSFTKKNYGKLDDISIDIAIMEKTKKGLVIPSDFGWSDIGSWKSLYDFLPKDKTKNVIDGDVVTENTKNCFIMGRQRLIAANCLENMVIVETPDSVFVSDIANSRDVKNIVSKLKKNKRKEYQRHKTAYYQWGNITLLEQKKSFTVTNLVVYPGSLYKIANPYGRTKRFIAVNGIAKVESVGKTRRLIKGKAFVFSEKRTISISTPDNSPAELICVETV